MFTSYQKRIAEKLIFSFGVMLIRILSRFRKQVLFRDGTQVAPLTVLFQTQPLW
jgi:hypothetical protein